MVILEYQGEANGKYRGPTTCTWYPFRKGTAGYVDNRDSAHLLGLRDQDAKALFRLRGR